MRGSVYKRCSCPVQRNAKGERLACKKDHGSWYYVADVPSGTGQRRQLTKGGFSTRSMAQEALNELLEEVRKGQVVHDDRQLLGDYLRTWLQDKVSDGLRPNTVVGYQRHLDRYLVPHLGHKRVRDIRPTHVEAMLRQLSAPPPRGEGLGATTVRRVHATLSSALGAAVRKRLITYNAAAHVDLPKARRTKVRPWEPGELGAFLDGLAGHPFAAVYELSAASGLRRGEALGLRWEDVSLPRHVLVVRRQLLQPTHDRAAGVPLLRRGAPGRHLR